MNTCCVDIHRIDMYRHGQRCAGLIEMTADLLTPMLVATQSIKQAIQL